jgi:hypothetical protein
MATAIEIYDDFDITKHRLTIGDGANEWWLEDWKADPLASAHIGWPSLIWGILMGGWHLIESILCGVFRRK